MAIKKIVVLDTGKEWGGGTNSLIELLKRVDKRLFSFTAVFYANYKHGANSDIKTELEKLGVKFICLARPKATKPAKAKKELMRAILSLSPGLKKKFLFNQDFKERIMPLSKLIAETLDAEKAALLYMNNQPSSNLEGFFAAKAAGVACVQHARVEITPTPFEAKTVNENAAKVICVSNGVLESLVKGGVSRALCTVVHNGIDPSLKPLRDAIDIRKKYSIPDDAFLIGTAGSLIKRKRVGLLLEAMSGLKKDTGAYCLIAGEGPEEGNLKKMAVSLGLAKRVIFTGFSTDAISLINAMDVFVLASETEGLPRVILEAMLMSKPCVAFGITGPTELITNNVTGMVLERQNSGALLAALIKLKQNPAIGKQMGTSARARVTLEFSIDKYVEGVTKVLCGATS
ncbi:glycosyltransferase [bacterium]|nr:MAG: glycosyltransferase [bacterium]